jgi:hypothetical protein
MWRVAADRHPGSVQLLMESFVSRSKKKRAWRELFAIRMPADAYLYTFVCVCCLIILTVVLIIDGGVLLRKGVRRPAFCCAAAFGFLAASFRT